VNPTDIREQSFDVARRGYRQTHVQAYLAAVAEALDDAQRREADMRSRLGKAIRRAEKAEGKLRKADAAKSSSAKVTTPQSAEPQMKDPARQSDEVASVLRAARDAGQQRISAAEKEADRILAAAKAECAEMRAEAGADCSKIVSRLEQARVQGDHLIGEAEEARAQILEDLERRRRQARAQVERLRVGRDRLLRSYDLVRRTLDETTEELKGSLKEAKLRGDSAARDIMAAPLATRDELEAELQAARLIGRAPAAPQPLDEPLEADELLVVDEIQAELAVPEALVEAEPVSEDPGNDVPRPRKPVVGIGGKRGIPAQPKAPAFAPSLTPSPKPTLEPTTAAHAGTAAPVPAVSVDDLPDTVFGTDADLIDLTDEALDAELAKLADDNLDVVQPADEIEQVSAIASDPAKLSSVEDQALFDALRAQQSGENVESAAPLEEAASTPTPSNPSESATVKPGDGQVDALQGSGGQGSGVQGAQGSPRPENAALPHRPVPGIAAQRDAVIADAAKELEKQLKRALADEQNELLASLRRTKKKQQPVELSGIVGDEDAHLSRYVAAINEVAAITYGAGAALMDAEAKSGNLPAGAVEELLVAQVVSPIRAQLESLDQMDVSSADMHLEPVQTFYRQQTSDSVGDAATDLARLLCIAGVCDSLPSEAPLPWAPTTN